MGVSNCIRCGAEYEYGADGDDPFTTITVSHHDEERNDFSQSFCQDCGDEMLEEVYTEVSEVPA